VYLVLGAAAGFLADDLLKAAGLHWLTWPLLAGLAVACAAWRFLRKRS
jgi:hypothetical protein